MKRDRFISPPIFIWGWFVGIQNSNASLCVTIVLSYVYSRLVEMCSLNWCLVITGRSVVMGKSVVRCMAWRTVTYGAPRADGKRHARGFPTEINIGLGQENKMVHHEPVQVRPHYHARRCTLLQIRCDNACSPLRCWSCINHCAA